MGIEAHCKTFAPLARVDLFHIGRWTFDSSVVDKHIKTAQRGECRVQPRFKLILARDIDTRCANFWALVAELRKGRFVDIANVHASTVVGEAFGNVTSDTRGRSGDYDSERGNHCFLRNLMISPFGAETELDEQSGG
jgi:hypothetical protein